MTPAIVVLGYERPKALDRLLRSLDRAYYPPGEEVPLVITLDRASGTRAAGCAALAQAFQWRFGPKRVIEQPEHLGVVHHFWAAGELTREYGDIILLEDDLTVSPAFFQYAGQVLDRYGNSDVVAGACLYGLWFNGFTQEPFLPIEDGADVFFLGVPYTQGVCFSRRQWEAFAAWSDHGTVTAHANLHSSFLKFGKDEWFPTLASYMAQTGRFFSYPRVSLTVGWGDPGAHFSDSTAWFQTPLQLGQRHFQALSLDQATAVYDGFFELLPDRLHALAPHLLDLDFDLDLNATKLPANLQTDLVLTTRPVRRAEAQFGLVMYPPEVNVVLQSPGTEISLARVAEVRWDKPATMEARRRLHTYHWRRHRPSKWRALRFAVAQGIDAMRRLRQ